MLFQLADFVLVAADLILKTFDLLLVVTDFLLMMMFQSSYLFPLLLPTASENR